MYNNNHSHANSDCITRVLATRQSGNDVLVWSIAAASSSHPLQGVASMRSGVADVSWSVQSPNLFAACCDKPATTATSSTTTVTTNTHVWDLRDLRRPIVACYDGGGGGGVGGGSDARGVHLVRWAPHDARTLATATVDGGVFVFDTRNASTPLLKRPSLTEVYRHKFVTSLEWNPCPQHAHTFLTASVSPCIVICFPFCYVF
jgi:WD40 repeat protein